jgi:peptidoglycan/LPS O-acetylase OafA/YrhL
MTVSHPTIQRPTTQRRYYPELDGVRAIAAIMVMLFHSSQAGLPIHGLINLGQTGVDLFFVLSGFLITSILLTHRQHDWTEVRVFYARRSLRIFPLYFGYLVLLRLIGRSVSWPYWAYLQNFYNAFSIQVSGPTHFWSLAVEEHFYLVWPFLVLFAPRRILVPVLWILVAGAPILRYCLTLQGIQVFYLTFTRIDGLAAGALIAALHGKIQRFKALTIVSGMITCAILLFVTSYFGRGRDLAWFIAVKYSITTALYSLLIMWLLASPNSVIPSLFRWSPLRFVGRVSYGLYVFHPLIFALLFERMAMSRAIVKGTIGFAAVFCVATASWYFFERPFIRMKDHLVPDKKSPLEAPINV